MAAAWLLAEFPGDAAALAPAARPGDRWLALTPAALEELEAGGFAPLPDGDVCPPDELNGIGRANFARVEALVEACDRAIRSQCPSVGRCGLWPCRAHLTRVKFLLDAICVRLHIVKALAAGGAKEFCKAHPLGAAGPTIADLFYEADASLYGDILALLEAQQGLRARWIPRAPVPAVSRPLPHPAAALRRLADLASCLRGPGRSVAVPRRLLLLNVGYDLRPIADAYRDSGGEVFWLDLPRLRLYRYRGWRPCRVEGDAGAQALVRDVTRELTAAALDDAMAGLCHADGTSFAPLVSRALMGYLRGAFPRALAAGAFVEACHRRFSFDLVLSPAGPDRAETQAIFEACRRAQVPIAVVQHGGYGYVDNPITSYYEFGFEGDFLAWGPGVEAHYGPTKRGAVRFVPVGSPTLDGILARRERTATRPRRVMYIITDLRGSSAYFPGGQPWLDTTYYRFQREVLEVLQRYQDTYDIWLKVPPGSRHNRLARNLIRRWLRARGARIRVAERPLAEVIGGPSLFLIDFPSTTLLQCVATRAHVIALTGAPHFPLLPEARLLLEKRAVCCDSPEQFLEAIEARLRQGIAPDATGVDDAFLTRYGTFRHDGGSLARIMGHLEAAGASPAGRAPCERPLA